MIFIVTNTQFKPLTVVHKAQILVNYWMPVQCELLLSAKLVRSATQQNEQKHTPAAMQLPTHDDDDRVPRNVIHKKKLML